MIDRKRLNDIAFLRRLAPKNAEKEYFQELILYILYRLTGRELIFKGGTCLYKLYNLNRFSEDLDFNVLKNFNVGALIRKVIYNTKLLDINSSIKFIDSYPNVINIGLNFSGPLYDGSKESLCFLLLNFSLRKKPLLPCKSETISSIFNEFPNFEVYAMEKREMLAEKIDAVFNRKKARDVYDVWFLMKKLQVPIETSLINKKVGKKFNPNIFMRKIDEKKNIWESELGRLIIGNLPAFNVVKEDIKNAIAINF